MTTSTHVVSGKCAMLQSIFENVGFLSADDNTRVKGLVFVISAARVSDAELAPPHATYVAFTFPDGEEETFWGAVRKSPLCSAVASVTRADVTCVRCSNGDDKCNWKFVDIKQAGSNKFEFHVMGSVQPLTGERVAYDEHLALLYLAGAHVGVLSGRDAREGAMQSMIDAIRAEREQGRVMALATTFQLLWLTHHFQRDERAMYRLLIQAPVFVLATYTAAGGETTTIHTVGVPQSGDGLSWSVGPHHTVRVLDQTLDQTLELYRNGSPQAECTLDVANPFVVDENQHVAVIFTGAPAHVEVEGKLYRPRIRTFEEIEFVTDSGDSRIELLTTDRNFRWHRRDNGGTGFYVYEGGSSPFSSTTDNTTLTYKPFGHNAF